MAMLQNRLTFTAKIEEALATWMPRRNLASYRVALLAKRTASIVAIRRADMEKNVRRQYSTLLTLFHEQLALLDELIASSNPASVWESEMRFYAAADGTITCKCGRHELLVGDDFPAARMLVCTPLSRKCRAEMIEALMTGKIYASAGPAGTGKTETIKDTFMMLGMTPVTLNCTEQTGEAPSEAIERALASGGTHCPVIFDEFNKIPAEAMAGVAEATAGRTFCALTYNPGSAGRAALPEAFKARRVIETPMSAPSLVPIVAVMLSAEGFVQCDELGKALVEVVGACKEEMSGCPHYDFGLRFFKSIGATAGALGRRSKGFEKETQLVADVVGATLFARSTPDDRVVALAQIQKGFGVAPAIPPAFEAGSSAEARVAAMAAATASIRHGVAILGAADLDATVRAIDEAMGAESIVVRASADALFGEAGAFTQAFKAAALKTTPVNVVLATPLDAAAAEPLHSVLDDNKALAVGSGGTKIRMTPHMRVVLFEKDAASWSPALVSRIGIVSAL